MLKIRLPSTHALRMIQTRRDKSCEKRVLSLGPPKAQPPGNAQAQVLQTRATSGERPRPRASVHRRGVAPRALDLSGTKDRGVAGTRVRVVPL
jgi:hypothetical protein